jgi:hypothetical protein
LKLLAIGSSVFEGCFKLSLQEFPDTCTTVQQGAFAGCSLIRFSDLKKLASAGAQAFLNTAQKGIKKLTMSKIKSIASAQNLTSSGAFSGAYPDVEIIVCPSEITIDGTAYSGTKLIEKLKQHGFYNLQEV